MQFSSAAFASQAEAARLEVSGCIIALTAPTSQAPAYAFAAYAAAATAAPEGAKPTYVYALTAQIAASSGAQAGMSQMQYAQYAHGQAGITQWPGYDYSAYGYGMFFNQHQHHLHHASL